MESMPATLHVGLKTDTELTLIQRAAALPHNDRSASSWARRVLVREALREIREATDANPKETT